jgi:hypothetical protein
MTSTGDRVTLVERLSGALANRIDRRGFLARTAVVGSALAVAPTDYLLHPTTAYAAVCSCAGQGCGCGAFCCDGYTEFCCTIYGTNACPPGTAVAGWWKADGSGFCNGPRYYMDCNSGCGTCGCGSSGVCSGSCSGTNCGCALGNCNYRRAGCNLFRYGQCNQSVSCLGPIVCRLVTCIPPWEIEPSCTETVAVDDSTAFHDAPCLHLPNGGFDSFSNFGQQITVTGWAIDYDTTSPIDVDLYLDGAFVQRVLANQSRPDSVPAHAGHGFTATFNASEGTHTLCVYGINVDFGSTNPKMACETIQVTGNPVGHFEALTQSGPGQITVSGWAIDPDTTSPIDVDIYLDGAFHERILASGSRPDVANAYPGYGPDHGFSVNIGVSGGTHPVCVYAINTGNGNTNTGLGCKSITLGGNPFGNLEVVKAGPDQVVVSGWAIDPDTASPIDVDVYLDGAFHERILANGNRPDVANAYPGYGPNHGFSVTIGVSGGTHQVCVYGINTGVGTTNPKIGCNSVIVGGNPFGNLEVITPSPGHVTVSGWALDPDTASPIDVDLYLDGAFHERILANGNRPDVGQSYPAWGPNHGFSATIGVSVGTHTVCAYGINTGSGTTNTKLGCRSAQVTS